ncbi:hypothetical protein BHE74_00013921 [Ensete ventricosum]|nr:hypothetical protein BHE74_00013921 [Ensete ventricosum]
MEELEKVFARFDVDGDGRISTADLAGFIRALGSDASPDEIRDMIAEMDADRDGFVDLQEFAALCHGGGGSVTEKELKDAFSVYDLNNDGRITVKELHQVLNGLGEKCSMKECMQMIGAVDSDGDGCVSFEEFKTMMTGSAQTTRQQVERGLPQRAGFPANAAAGKAANDGGTAPESRFDDRLSRFDSRRKGEQGLESRSKVAGVEERRRPAPPKKSYTEHEAAAEWLELNAGKNAAHSPPFPSSQRTGKGEDRGSQRGDEKSQGGAVKPTLEKNVGLADDEAAVAAVPHFYAHAQTRPLTIAVVVPGTGQRRALKLRFPLNFPVVS